MIVKLIAETPQPLGGSPVWLVCLLACFGFKPEAGNREEPPSKNTNPSE